jgi:short subunit fatty acids transporter
LTGDRSALEERVARLLQPLAGEPKDRTPTTLQVAFLLSLALVVAVALGVVYGERFVGTLLALS